MPKNLFALFFIFSVLLYGRDALEAREPLDRPIEFLVGADAGYSQQSTKVPTELDKRGFHGGAKFVFNLPWRQISMDVGAGYAFNYMEGSSSTGTVLNEDIKSQIPFIELAPRFRISDRIEFGPISQIWIGNDIGLNATGSKKNFVAVLGPQLLVRTAWLENRSLNLSLSGLTDLNIPQRQTYIIVLGIQVGLHRLGRGRNRNHPSRQSLETLKKDPQPQQLQIDRRKEKVGEKRFSLEGDKSIQFRFSSSELSDDTRKKLYEFAKGLQKHNKKWGSLVIEGHTDSLGDESFNRDLSQARATAVLNFLKDSGVDESKLSTQAFGESEPLYEDPTSALNRRVEFLFKDVKDAEVVKKLMQALH